MAEYIIKEKNGEKITVRDLQLEILTIMDEVDRVCRKNKIKYALHAGSSLGIVNYKGFIPWDDDIDVIVNKDDYHKFIKALKKDLKKDFVFQCYETNKKYNVLIPNMKIRKKNTFITESNTFLKNRCNDSNGIFVDVIWYGNVSENEATNQINRLWMKFLMPLVVFLDNLHIDFKPLKNYIVRYGERFSDKNKDSKYCSQTISIPWEKLFNYPKFLKEDIYPFKEYDFEGRKYYSYNNIPKVMKEWYGEKSVCQLIDGKYIDVYPENKRVPKHTADINLKNGYHKIDYKDIAMKMFGYLSLLMFVITFVLMNDASLPFCGLGIIFLGISILLYNNRF
ncbi:MAG: LicD family protein [Mycoplasmatota bacterium]